MFNSFNRPNFGNPGSSPDSIASYRCVTSVGDSRIFQLGLRYFLREARTMFVSHRRAFLRVLAAQRGEKLPPDRAVTRGPKFHCFGYYDKLQFDPTDRYALGMQVDFEHRAPRADDVIRIGMVDLQDGDRWIELSESRAWSWQQSCMLQWLPGSKSEIIWNDRQGGQFVAHILDVESGRRRTLPSSIANVSPDDWWALTTDFARVAHTRPNYGCEGVPDPNQEVGAPTDSGVWRVDLKTGKRTRLVSLADMHRIAIRPCAKRPPGPSPKRLCTPPLQSRR